MRLHWQILLLILLPLAWAVPAFFLFSEEKQPRWRVELAEDEVLLEDILRWEQDFLWVDARSAGAFAKDHIPGAFNLNEDTWNDLLFQNLEKIVTGKPLVIYCDSQQCDSSRAVARRLKEEGYTEAEIHILHDGWQAWTRHLKRHKEGLENGTHPHSHGGEA